MTREEGLSANSRLLSPPVEQTNKYDVTIELSGEKNKESKGFDPVTFRTASQCLTIQAPNQRRDL